MSFHSLKSDNRNTTVIIHRLPRILVPFAIFLSIYLYLYPVFLGCVFPSTDGRFESAFTDTLFQHITSARVNPLETQTNLAPFRLLVLADPQLEGDSSLPKSEDAISNKIIRHWEYLRSSEHNGAVGYINTIQEVLTEFVVDDIPNALKALRKRVDLFGNDYYLAHIYRTLHWWTKPTHVTVLGDLVGSQWVDDEEFEWRGWRYWNRVFRGGERVGEDIMESGTHGGGITLKMNDPAWRTKIVNIAGNHDVGYAGDITRGKMERFEAKYGKASWDVRFEYPASRTNTTISMKMPTLHLVVLNSMLLDTPAMEDDLLNTNYEYLNSLIKERVSPVEDRTDFTLLLTHVPLHKKEGICIDAPMFEFWDEDNCSEGDCKPGGLKEQNHLSEFISQSGVLQSIFGMSGNSETPAQGIGRPGLVLTGHDHEGCDVWHYIPLNSTFRASERKADEEEKKTLWEATTWNDMHTTSVHTGIREVTLRSMMGEFSGNAGLLSAWFDFKEGEWRYDLQTCKLGVQHIWWAIHVIDLLAFGSIILSVIWSIQQMSTINVTQNPGAKSLKVE